MVFGFISRRKPDPAWTPQLPAGIRVYAIGDIHGRVDLLRRLHDMIAADAAKAPHLDRRVVYLGDYIDRGMDSRQVIDLIMTQPPAGLTPILLKGNHEAAMLDFMERPESGPAWLDYGGLSTLFSYGVSVPRPPLAPDGAAALSTELAARVPADHRAFLANLRVAADIGDYFFVHAGVRPGVPLAAQTESDLLWIREDFLKSSADHGKMIVHGHTIVPEPDIRPNRIGIDTGAFVTGRLTCLVLEGASRRFLATGSPSGRAG